MRGQSIFEDAARMQLGKGIEECILSTNASNDGSFGGPVCNCKKCSFEKLISKGLKKISLEKRKFEKIKEISQTPLNVLMYIALSGLKTSVTVFFFSIILYLPLICIQATTPENTDGQQVDSESDIDSGTEITAAQIIQAVLPPQNVIASQPVTRLLPPRNVIASPRLTSPLPSQNALPPPSDLHARVHL